MPKSMEDYPTSLKSMLLGQDIMELALAKGIDAAIKDRDERIEADRQIQGFDGITVLVTGPRIAYYGLQKWALRALGK